MTTPRPEDALQHAMQDAVERAGAATVLFSVQFLMKGGATPNQAMRLASFMLIDTLGSGVLRSVGMSDSTATRWRAEIRKFRDAAGGLDAMDATTDVPRLAQILVEGRDA